MSTWTSSSHARQHGGIQKLLLSKCLLFPLPVDLVLLLPGMFALLNLDELHDHAFSDEMSQLLFIQSFPSDLEVLCDLLVDCDCQLANISAFVVVCSIECAENRWPHLEVSSFQGFWLLE